MPVEIDVIEGILTAAISAIGSLYPIKAPGITFVTPDDDKYVELLLIQQNSLLSVPRTWVGSSPTWGDDEMFSGIIRVILHWPIDGQGIIPPNLALIGIKDQFPKGRIVFYGQAKLLIYDNPSITDVIEGDTENLYPLTVPYQYFHIAP